MNSEEHRKVFPEPPLIAFRRCKNLKDILVRARLSNEGNGGTDKKGCSRCSKSRCQVCNVMSNSEYFHSTIDSRQYRINYSLNWDSSNVVYLLECTVCGVPYVGSTCTPFRLRFNNYKAFDFSTELFVRDTRCFFRVFCPANPLSDLSIVCFVVTCDLFQLRRDRHSHRLQQFVTLRFL